MILVNIRANGHFIDGLSNNAGYHRGHVGVCCEVGPVFQSDCESRLILRFIEARIRAAGLRRLKVAHRKPAGNRTHDTVTSATYTRS